MDTPELSVIAEKLKNELTDNTLRVYLFNVSQGDHLLIKMPNGEFGIIDFFHSSYGLNQKSPPGVDFLKQVQRILPEQKITLAFIYLSHPDNDHLKGIPHLLNWLDDPDRPIKVRHLWWFGGNNLNKFFMELENLSSKYLKQNHDPALKMGRIAPFKEKLREIQRFVENRRKDPDFKAYNIVDIGFLCNLGSKEHRVKVYKKAPLTDHINEFKNYTDDHALKNIERYLKLQDDDQLDIEDHPLPKPEYDNNSLSGVIKMIYQNFKLIFGGDAPTATFEGSFESYKHRELEDDSAYPDYEAHFIKAAHHGSRNSSTLKIWKRLFEKGYQHSTYVGFSAGFNYGHPHEETLDHIAEAQKKTLGQVCIHSTNDQAYNKLNYPTESLDWIYESFEEENNNINPNKHPDTEFRANQVGPRTPASPFMMREEIQEQKKPVSRRTAMTKSPHPTLAAFIYEFDPQQEKIKVTKGITHYYKDRRTQNNRRSFLSPKA